MVVMNIRTMNAQTKLDLKTSSLIWEYCVWGGGGEKEFKQMDSREVNTKAGASRPHPTMLSHGHATSIGKRAESTV